VPLALMVQFSLLCSTAGRAGVLYNFILVYKCSVV
jgi:hypothetical protein